MSAHRVVQLGIPDVAVKVLQRRIHYNWHYNVQNIVENIHTLIYPRPIWKCKAMLAAMVIF